jgi:hypothetical protein|tara:strand:- start:49 stop:657 length:609 start_codon:yes stop_codon:yes gene_type:complete
MLFGIFDYKKTNMKKITLLLLLGFLTLQINAQEKEGTKESKYPQDVDKKYELKINAFNLIGLSALDLSYEKLINTESSYGVALFYNFTDINDDLGFPKKFSLTPFYRWFFSESTFARGFFVEGFGMINTYQDIYYRNNSESIENDTSFALGISVGGKFITKSGFTTEVYLGVGRNLIKNEDEDNYFEFNIVGRFGISLGYRF